MVQLYYDPGSIHSQKVLFALVDKGMDWDPSPLRLSHCEHYAADYLQLNPNATVPTLVDGSTVLSDSAAIIEHLERRQPSAGVELELVRAWLKRVSSFDLRTYTHGVVRGSERKALETTNDHRIEVLGDLRKKHTDLKDLYDAKIDDLRESAHKVLDPERIMRSRHALEKLLDQAMEQLMQTPWLAGQGISGADHAFAPLLARMFALRAQHRILAREEVSQYYEKIKERPAFRSEVLKHNKAPSWIRRMFPTRRGQPIWS
jgi:glutathione S-transferase